MSSLFLVLGVVALALALRTTHRPALRKAGAACVLAASYLAGYFLLSSHLAGAAAVLLWFLLPWVELLTRIRRLRLPLRKDLVRQAPPNSRRFPHLAEFTREIEEQGFEHVEDAGWEWDSLRQFFRIFYHPEQRTQAALCFNEQGGMSFVFVSLTSRVNPERVYRTWNFPFGYTLKISPETRVNRVADASSFEELLWEHQDFLERMGVGTENLMEEDPQRLPSLMEAEAQLQIRYNIENGLIRHTREDPEQVRYSWRGLFYLYGQLVKDMVKLS